MTNEERTPLFHKVHEHMGLPDYLNNYTVSTSVVRFEIDTHIFNFFRVYFPMIKKNIGAWVVLFIPIYFLIIW